MASIHHKPGSPKPWVVRYRTPDGRSRSRSFRLKGEADDFEHEVESRLNRGEWIDPNRGKVKLAEVADDWWATHSSTLEVSTRKAYGSMLEHHVIGKWGRWPVAGIEYADVAKWASDLNAEGLSGSTVRKAVGMLSQVLDHAMRDGRIGSNPAKLVKKPRVATARRHRYLDADELERLADAAGDQREVVLVLGWLGLRWGEMAALRPQDVDLARGRLHIDRAATRLKSEVVYHAPKNHQRREVPVPDFLIEALRPLMHGELVFVSPNGLELHHSNWRRRVFLPALERAGLPQMRIHELRHTAASLAVSAGADLLTVARMLGHDPSVTGRVYADLFDRDLDVVRTRMEQMRAKTRAREVVTDLESYRRG
jgi:integrase